MTDQLREAARALLDYLDAGGVTYGRPLVAEGRIADLRAALDATPPAVDVERLAEALRRHDCDNSTPTACAQVIAGEYGRLLAERDRLIGQGVDPADLDMPLPPASETPDD
jgi:hypothetical protein